MTLSITNALRYQTKNSVNVSLTKPKLNTNLLINSTENIKKLRRDLRVSWHMRETGSEAGGPAVKFALTLVSTKSICGAALLSALQLSWSSWPKARVTTT